MSGLEVDDEDLFSFEEAEASSPAVKKHPKSRSKTADTLKKQKAEKAAGLKRQFGGDDSTTEEDNGEPPVKKEREERGDTSPPSPTDIVKGMPWRLMALHRQHGMDNTGCVSLSDLVAGKPKWVLLADYMIDPLWVQTALPALKHAEKVVVWVCAKQEQKVDSIARGHPVKRIRCPMAFGCHHTKLILVGYPDGLRVVVHTANLIYVDANNKTQGVWWQDFPHKNDCATPDETSPFEEDLVGYLEASGWTEGAVDRLRKYDFSDARVRLVGSVPGRFAGAARDKWGHMKLRRLLQREQCAGSWPVVAQFSSLGSVNEKWIDEMKESLHVPLKSPLEVVWPTAEDVRLSVEGYAAGNSIPGPAKNVDALKELKNVKLHGWRAGNARADAAPHIKSYTKYDRATGEVGWFLLTSANLSGAAWGKLEKKGSQLFIMHYELGVLITPSTLRGRSGANVRPFAITPGPPSPMFGGGRLYQAGRAPCQAAHLPIPYSLPPVPYTPRDIPWSWDRTYATPDHNGQRSVYSASFYGRSQD